MGMVIGVFAFSVDIHAIIHLQATIRAMFMVFCYVLWGIWGMI